MYLLAGLFHETGMAFITYVCINLFFGINSIVSLSVVYFLSKEKPNDPVRSIISPLNFNKHMKRFNMFEVERFSVFSII